MATVTITEILGGDNIAASRIVLNNNFSLLQNAINTLETRLNTSYVPGGSLNAGDVQILKYNRAAATNLLLCQGSAQIDGNLSLGTPTSASALGLTGSLTVSANQTVAGDVTFSNVSGADVFTNYLETIANDSEANAQWYAATTKSPVVLTQALTGAFVLPIGIHTRVLHLSIAAYTGVGAFAKNTFQMPAVSIVNNGQVVTLVFDDVSAVAGSFEIDNTVNFDPAFNNTALPANIVFNGTITSTAAKMRGIFLTLCATTTGWKIIGAHTDVVYS